MIEALKLARINREVPRELSPTAPLVATLEPLSIEIISDGIFDHVLKLKIRTFEEAKLRILESPIDLSYLDMSLKVKTQREIFRLVMQWSALIERKSV